LQLALGHSARFAQTGEYAGDIFDRLLIDRIYLAQAQQQLPPEVPAEESETRDAEAARAHKAAAVTSARAILYENRRSCSDDFPVHFQ